MNVLVVDDDRTSRLLAAAALEKMGHAVTEAASGEEALETLRVSSIHVVIADWVMEGIDGLELCRRIRAADREDYVYVIMLTRRSGRQDHRTGMLAGADDFLSKPLEPETLELRLGVAERIAGMHHRLHDLERLLAMCSYCRRVRDEHKSWRTVESYLEDRSHTRVSHGICPECLERELERMGR